MTKAYKVKFGTSGNPGVALASAAMLFRHLQTQETSLFDQPNDYGTFSRVRKGDAIRMGRSGVATDSGPFNTPNMSISNNDDAVSVTVVDPAGVVTHGPVSVPIGGGSFAFTGVSIESDMHFD